MRRWPIWIMLLTCGLVWGLRVAEAQPARKVFRVGYLYAGSIPLSAPIHVAFVQRLKDLGYVQGQNLIIEHRKADGQADRLPDLAAELARLPVDVIVATGPEAVLRAASQATRTIPIVMMAVNYDPIAKGYIASLARPGGNITGAFFMQLTLSAKRLEILKQTLPQGTRVFVLYDEHSADQLPPTEAAAHALGLQLQYLELRRPTCRWSNPPNLSWSLTSRRPSRLASPFHPWCSFKPTR